jgi:hypothetical protein
MITVTPQGQVYICKTPLENDYKNQLTFATKVAQENYFNSTIIKTLDNYTYIKKDNVIKVGINIDEIIDCNYLFYRNNGFTNKIYYCFITKMEYVNENVTAITIETDCFQTWYFDIRYKKCFVEREHVNDDTIGLHTIPEGLEIGDYVDQPIGIDEDSDLNFLTKDGHSPYVVLAVSETGLDDALPSGSRIYNNVYSGLIFLTFPSTGAVDRYINYIQHHITEDIIYAAFMCPYEIATDGDNFEWLTFTDGSTTFQYAFIDYTTRATQMGLVEIHKPNNLDTYVPRNNKLFVFPYRYFNISNNSGSTATYKYEYFNSNDGKDDCQFTMLGAISPGCSIRLVPYNYKEGKSEFNYSFQEVDESIVAGKLPTCGWTNDAYTNWLTQNAINIPLDIASDIIKTGVGVATGNVALAGGGLAGIGGTMAEIYQHSLIPTTAKGGVNQGDLNFANKLCFSVYKKSIKYEYAKIIDNYFDMFGYKINDVKIPNITGRQNWNYVKTIDCNFDGDIPQTDLNIIKAMFNGGVTFWHNPANILNYSLSNIIV